MLFWHEYKIYREKAETIVLQPDSDNQEIAYELHMLKIKKQSKEKTIENIINILSEGQHYAPLHDFRKIGNQQNLFNEEKHD